MIKYSKGYKYQLEEDVAIQTTLRPASDIEAQYISLSKEGVLKVREGYAWDGPSGPTVDTENSMQGSLFHDAMYQLIREGFLSEDVREYADYLLENICVEDGMWVVRAAIWEKGVRWFAGFAIKPDAEHKIFTAGKVLSIQVVG